MLMIDGDYKIGADYSELDDELDNTEEMSANTDIHQSKSNSVIIAFGLIMFLSGVVCGYIGVFISLCRSLI